MRQTTKLFATLAVFTWSGAALAQGGEGSSPTPTPTATPMPAPETTPDAGGGLEALLSKEVAVGETGSFGYRLTSYGVSPYVHAYTTAEWFDQQGGINTFDLHYFNVFIGADILGKIVPEVQLEHEHGGGEIGVRFAQVDMKVYPLLTVRVGSFLVPVGVFNEYLYPEFISKTADRPFVMREIVPSSWQEVGVQLRGVYDFGQGRNVSYAVFAVNGLEQLDDPTTPEIEDGGAIRDMRANFEDESDGDKAIGGRLGIEPFDGIRIGGSYYSGAYTVDGEQRLTIMDADAGVSWRDLTLRAEFVSAQQETAANGTLEKQGFYVIAAYKILSRIEPVVQYDSIRLDGDPANDRDRITAGFNWYPYPTDLPSAVVKVNYEMTTDDGPEDTEDDKFILQLSMGF